MRIDEVTINQLTAKSGRLGYDADGNGSVFPLDGLRTVVVIRTKLLALPFHHFQQYIVRRDEVAEQGVREGVVGSEVQLEQGVFSRRTSPERPVNGRLAAEGVDRLANRLGANISGILYGVEVGSWELMSWGKFL